MKIVKYDEEYKEQWDKFIDDSKNGTFLLKRDYMEYHKDRFEDCSFMFIDDKNNIKALIAGNIKEDVYYTHLGLTYGGFILQYDTKTTDVISFFSILNETLEKYGIKRVVYKSIPYIYSEYPSQEDEYVLFLLNARITSVGISSTIDLTQKFKYSKSRKSSISKSKRYNLEIEIDKNYKEFWNVLEENLQKNHKASPVHNLQEILYLKDKFKKEIKLYTVIYEKKVIAGTIVYIFKDLIHIQYISANELGKEISALDFLFDYLIKDEFKNKRYFDFGTSVENNGYFLNEGLIFQKEGFGGRGIVYKKYEYNIVK